MGRMTLCHFEAAVPFGTWSHAHLTATLYIDPRCLVRDNQVGLCPGLQKSVADTLQHAAACGL